MAICDGDGDGGVAIASGAKEGFGKQEEAAGPAGMLNLTTLQLAFPPGGSQSASTLASPCHVSRCALHTLPLNVTISTWAQQ
jgi:hypothetical protein